MDRTRSAPRLCFLIPAALTLLGVIARTVAMFTHFDAEIGYFDAGVLPTVSRALYFAVVILSVACAIYTRKDTLPAELYVPGRGFVAWPLGCAMALFTVALFLTSSAELFTKGGALKTVLTLLGLLGSSYFLLSANRRGRYPDWLTAGGYLPILWCMAGVAETYTDVYMTMNSPIKVSLQMGFIGFMLIMITELRFRLGKGLPRLAVTFLGIGTFFTLNAAVPVLAATALLGNTLHALYAAVLLFAGVYGGYILFRYTCAPGTPEEESDLSPAMAVEEDPHTDDTESPSVVSDDDSEAPASEEEA